MLIDTHCHVLSSEYDNPDLIIENSFKNGIDKIIINGFDLKSSIEAVALSTKYKNVYAAVGIGPQNIHNISKQSFIELEKLINNEKVVAIGEIGLDYYWTKENKEQQLYVFENMLKLAKKNNLPVIVHCREAINDVYSLVKKYDVSGILHCYSGSLESAKEFIKLGFLIGIGGVVTFKNAKQIKDVVKNIDLEYISLETDSPYLTPEPYRGSKNEPSNVKVIANKIAEIKCISNDEVIEVIGNNISAKFDI